MSDIFSKIRSVDPNDNDAAKETVTSFFQSLSKTSKFGSSQWLRSLVFVINRMAFAIALSVDQHLSFILYHKFPRYCISHRNTAEAVFKKYLASKNINNIIDAAKGAHSLQQVRPSQEKIATAKTCWSEQMNILCYSAHNLISSLFTTSVDLYQNGDTLELKSLVNSQLSNALLELNQLNNIKSESDKLAELSVRLRNVFIFIQAMLVEIYPVAKSIRPQTILDVIIRTLSVTSGKNISNIHNIADICMIKIQALRTLDALVACLSSNLIPYSALVIRLQMQTLRWTSDNDNAESRKVRCAAYKSLEHWLLVLRMSADNGRWTDELTTHVLNDVTIKAQATITITAQPSIKNLSKKAKRRLQNTMLQQSSLAAHMASEKNKIQSNVIADETVVIAALQCAETFLTVCGAFLKPTIHKQFHERIIRECYTMESIGERTLRLLNVLEASRRSCRNIPPPTQYCLALYSRFINSGDLKISKFCFQAIQDIRLHLHCSPPSLNFALESQKEDTGAKTKEKIVSERNRAALEALLGNSKIPSKTLNKEHLEDEPTAKKIKPNEEITDRISLSSDSVESVEISDDSNSGVAEDIQILEADQDNYDALEELNIDPVIHEEESNHSMSTQNGTKVVSANTETVNIYEAKTQLPINDSNDAVDGEEIQLSSEVGYDLPNTATAKVPVLEKMEDENLPSTNETDDVQINCGQLVTNSQDGESDKKDDVSNKKDDVTKSAPKVNGCNKYPKENIEKYSDDKENSVTVPIVNNKVSISVDDMLADFVDEVNEDIEV